MKRSTFFFLGTCLFALVYACSDTSRESKTAAPAAQEQKTIDTVCETKTIMDPNDPKPMALMMRQMANNAQQMKEQVASGQQLDSVQFPFIRFYLAEPTDSAVLEPQFFQNARLFQEAYREAFRHPDQQKKYYNAMIGMCIHCHESYCSGPLKRIRKLVMQ